MIVLDEGTFLVRESTSSPGQYVISLSAKGKVRIHIATPSSSHQYYHNKVVIRNGKYETSNGSAYDTLAQLIKFHSNIRDCFQCVLTDVCL